VWVTGQDARRRAELVAGWTGDARPDFASVNVRDEGGRELHGARRSAAMG
jgi:hypothetical protein